MITVEPVCGTLISIEKYWSFSISRFYGLFVMTDQLFKMCKLLHRLELMRLRDRRFQDMF